MKALIIHGTDRHTIRLQMGLQVCKIDVFICKEYEKLKNIPPYYFDMIFIDPTCNYDIDSLSLKANYIFFYDAEDDPSHFCTGLAYETMKDKVSAYAKMTYYDRDDRKDGIKNIAFPLREYLSIPKYQIDYSNISPFVPFFIGSPTYLGNHDPIPNGKYCSTDTIRCLGKYENGNTLYNQRYDWLLSLTKHNLMYQGGIVFQQNNNLSKEFQSRYFGDVSKLEASPINYDEQIRLLHVLKIGLCPTGHERNSLRAYDIMAAGAIMLRCETKGQKNLINPKAFITIPDGADLGEELLNRYSTIKQLQQDHIEHKINREVMESLTPQTLIDAFLNQLK